MTLQLILYNVIIMMVHHHVPYMKDLPANAGLTHLWGQLGSMLVY